MYNSYRVDYVIFFSIIAIQGFCVLLPCPIDPLTIRALIPSGYAILFGSVLVNTLYSSVDESTFHFPRHNFLIYI